MDKNITTEKYYKATSVFDHETLPDKLRKSHLTKAGTWGVIRVLEGRLRYVIEETGEEHILTPNHPRIVFPEQPHHVEPIGVMRMCVEFYDHLPSIEKQKP